MEKEKVEVCFERITTENMPESLKAADMDKVKGGMAIEIARQRGTRGGAQGADACACMCIVIYESDH